MDLCDWLQDGSRYSSGIPVVVDYLKKTATLDSKILDVGCGSGQLINFLIENDFAKSCLYGCDIEPGHVELAISRTQLNCSNIVCTDFIEHTPSFSGVSFFDYVIALDWLHNDWRAAHAVSFPKTDKEDSTYLEKIAESFNASVDVAGFAIFDWIGVSIKTAKETKSLQKFLSFIESKKFLCKCVLEDPEDKHPIYVYRKQK